MSKTEIRFDGKFFAWADGVPGVEIGSLPKPQPIKFDEPITVTMHFDPPPELTALEKVIAEWAENYR